MRPGAVTTSLNHLHNRSIAQSRRVGSTIPVGVLTQSGSVHVDRGIEKNLIIAAAVSSVVVLAACTGGVADGTSPSATSPLAPQSSAPTTSAPSPTATPTPRPTPTGPVELTIEEAGERYLTYICASNASIDVYSRARDKFDLYTSSDEEPHPKTKRAAQKAADALTAAAQGLSDAGYLWPEAVRNKVALLATDAFESAAVYLSIAEAETWSDAESFGRGGKAERAASTVRLALGLPPRGECPEEFRG